MGNSTGVLPGVRDVVNYFIHTDAVFNLRENERPRAPHFFRVALHHLQISAYAGGEVGLVDNQQVGLRDAGPAFARNFVTAADVNHLNGIVCQFTAEAGSQIVAARLNEQHLRLEFGLQVIERQQVRGDVLTNGGVGTAAGFHGANALRRQRLMLRQKLRIFPGENVVGHGGNIHGRPQPQAKLQHQSRLAAADRPADADGEGPLVKIAVKRPFAFVKMAGLVRVIVMVAVAPVGMEMQVEIFKHCLVLVLPARGASPPAFT